MPAGQDAVCGPRLSTVGSNEAAFGSNEAPFGSNEAPVQQLLNFGSQLVAILIQVLCP